MKIEGASALVTGANRGLGAAIAQALLDSGATVYGGARDPASITNDRVIPVRLDVTNDDDVAHAARTCTDVSIVVNNAGILRQSASLADGGVEAARAEMETNYFGSMRVARAFAPILRDNGGGALVNVLSVLSFISMPQGATYSASKSAAWSLTNALRIELRRQGTLVVAVHAGFIDTDMAAGVSGEKVSPESVAKQIVTAVAGDAEEVLADATSEMVKAALPERSHRAVSGAPGPMGHGNGGNSHERQREHSDRSHHVVQERPDPHRHCRGRGVRLPRARPEDGYARDLLGSAWVVRPQVLAYDPAITTTATAVSIESGRAYDD